MRSKGATYSLIVVLACLLIFIWVRRQEPGRKEAFNRAPHQLSYTGEALCLMDCGRISKDQVMEIMKKGIIHLNRSNRAGRPCPTFALQGRTSSGAKLQVIFAQCRNETKVVRCNNLEKDIKCHCPLNEN